MIAVIDIGNTRIKWAIVANGLLGRGGSTPHGGRRDAAIEALLGDLPSGIERALIANVAGVELGEAVADALHARFSIAPELVVPQALRYGVCCAYANPRRLGVDRWVALIAAHRSIAGTACVIQAGTAVTFDAIDAAGRHLGGLIFAGPRLSADALSRSARGIGTTAPAASRPAGLALLGRSTDEAVGNGALLALSAALDRAVETVAHATASVPTVLLTGGDASLLESWLETSVQSSADLVLRGLALIAELEDTGHA